MGATAKTQMGAGSFERGYAERLVDDPKKESNESWESFFDEDGFALGCQFVEGAIFVGNGIGNLEGDRILRQLGLEVYCPGSCTPLGPRPSTLSLPPNSGRYQEFFGA